jgi:hypothetical protein
VAKPRWVTALACLPYGDVFASGNYLSASEFIQVVLNTVLQGLGTASSDYGSSTIAYGHLLLWGKFLLPDSSTRCRSLYANRTEAEISSSLLGLVKSTVLVDGAR